MKRSFRFSLFLLVLAMSMGMSQPVVSQTGTVVRVSPALVYLEGGQTTTIEIWVDDVSDLFGFAVEIHFDPSKISAASTTLGGFLEPNTAIIDQIDTINGIIKYEMTQWGQETTSKSDSGVLITFEITLIQEVSETPLVIDSILLTDRNGVEIPCAVDHGKVRTPGLTPAFEIFLPLVMQ